MTFLTECNKIQLRVVPRPAAECLVVNLQTLSSSAVLALPLVTRKNFLEKSLVCLRFKAKAWTFRPNLTHDAFTVA